MLLRFGSVQLDTKRLPAVNGLYVYPPASEGLPVLVNITLVSDTRAAVEKWAKRLGVPVVERIAPLYEGDVRPLEVAAEVETDSHRVRVYTRTAAPAVAAGACPCQCTAAFCRCSDPGTCTCGPDCPVCDKDGGAS